MNTQTKQKRLRRIQAALGCSSTAGETIMVYELYDVPDSDHAIKRGQKASANHLVFVPLRGAICSIDLMPSRQNGTPAFAVAFQGKNPTDGQMRRLVKWGARDDQSAERTIVVSGQPLHSGSETGRRGIVSFQRFGKVIFCVVVDPSELP